MSNNTIWLVFLIIFDFWLIFCPLIDDLIIKNRDKYLSIKHLFLKHFQVISVNLQLTPKQPKILKLPILN